ncbi:MAG: DUF3768 domain-containing protein [Nitrospira sp.]|nr:DUF3768 domain-containing protein [Nitrospira sp.]
MDRQKQAESVRSLNDRFRSNVPGVTDVPGRVMLTQGIRTLTDDEAEPGKLLPQLFKAVRDFETFDENNDPYQEHDFGAFDFEGEKVFWKIDYYAPDLLHGSEDPADTAKTVRVLTVMLASEY